MRSPLATLLCLLIALALMAGCTIQMDLDFARDGSGSGLVTAKGKDLPDDANGFRNDLIERGLVVSTVESDLVDGERRLRADVTWPAFQLGAEHPFIERSEADGDLVRWTLRKARMNPSVPSEFRLDLPGTPISASGGRIDGGTVIYPGPDREWTWDVVFKPGMGFNGKLILAVVALIALVTAAWWALRHGDKPKAGAV